MKILDTNPSFTENTIAYHHTPSATEDIGGVAKEVEECSVYLTFS